MKRQPGNVQFSPLANPAANSAASFTPAGRFKLHAATWRYLNNDGNDVTPRLQFVRSGQQTLIIGATPIGDGTETAVAAFIGASQQLHPRAVDPITGEVNNQFPLTQTALPNIIFDVNTTIELDGDGTFEITEIGFWLEYLDESE